MDTANVTIEKVDEEIEEFLKTASPVKEIAANIVQKAISNYSDDNCTAVVLKIKE